MSLDTKVRFEFESLSREEAIQSIEEAGFRILPMKYTQGLFGQYEGTAEAHGVAIEKLREQGIEVIYRESEIKKDGATRDN